MPKPYQKDAFMYAKKLVKEAIFKRARVGGVGGP